MQWREKSSSEVVKHARNNEELLAEGQGRGETAVGLGVFDELKMQRRLARAIGGSVVAAARSRSGSGCCQIVMSGKELEGERRRKGADGSSRGRLAR